MFPELFPLSRHSAEVVLFCSDDHPRRGDGPHLAHQYHPEEIYDWPKQLEILHLC